MTKSVKRDVSPEGDGAMPKPNQFDPEVVFPRVALYIRNAGTTYIEHRELVKLLEEDEVIRSHVQQMQEGGYKGGLQDIATKMVGFFSRCWTDGFGPLMDEYQNTFVRDRIKNRYAYRLKN